jgi:hypothetical protein
MSDISRCLTKRDAVRSNQQWFKRDQKSMLLNHLPITFSAQSSAGFCIPYQSSIDLLRPCKWARILDIR